PGRVIPRSILLSLCTVAVLYAAIHLSILGIIPWREMLPAVPGGKAPEISNFIVSVMMERVYGRTVSQWFTLLILWTTMGSLFALLLGYSRIPFAAARDGVFFAPFGKLHPHGFPALSLVVIGLIAIVCSFLPLEAVIGALLTTRILIQFVGQAVGLVLLRRYRPELERPYRLWAYPWPCVIAVIGWLYLFGTAGAQAIGFGMISLILGIGAYLLWAKQRAEWPFAPSAPSEAPASSQ
ncbi:MAG: amino acid permease, partial [Armatimonadetes bacterium]|nr:amino acid permease [Armatimonadota bacterium]